MLKRAKVLRVFERKDIKKTTYSGLKSILNHYNLNVNIYPEYSDDAKTKIFQNMIPKTLLCVTQSTGLFGDNYAFLCSPASSINFSSAVKPGEDVWYFEDETFNVDDILDTYMPRFYWLSRVSGTLKSEYLSHTDSFLGFESLYSEEINDPINVNMSKKYYDTVTPRDRYFSDINEVSLQSDKGNILRIGDASHDNMQGVVDIVAGKNHYLESTGFFDDPDEESNMSFINDASRILVSEQGYFSNDINEVYNDSLTSSLIVKNKYDSSIRFNINNNKMNVLSYEEKENLYEALRNINKSENIENFILSEVVDTSLKPNITLKSSTINIVSKDNENTDQKISEEDRGLEGEGVTYNGQIRLIKESSTLKNSSQILMDNNNDIVIDGNTLYLGSFNRLLVDKDIVEESFLNEHKANAIESLNDDQKSSLKELSGAGEQVLIGYEHSLSEPLVLGNTLVVLLKDMIDLTQLTIDQNKILNDKVKSLSEEFVNHTHLNTLVLAGTAGPVPLAGTATGPSNPTTSIANHTTFNSSDTISINNDLTDIQTKLDDVKANLKYILSRFAKTSWHNNYKIKRNDLLCQV